MGFSPLADMKRRIPDVGRSSERLSKVQGVLVHHNAGVNAYGQATAEGREVSAHYWITYEGDLLPNIDEDRRAWTSGHPAYPAGALADHRFITVEVSNSRTGGNWPISEAAEDMLARLIGDVHKRYKLGQVKRGTQSGVAVHRDFVATECPGGYVMANLDRIIRKAEQYRTTGAAGGSNGEQGMSQSQVDEIKKYVDARTRSAGGSPFQIVKSGKNHWLQTPMGRVGIWGADLSALRDVIVALNWQRRDGAGPKGKSDVAYATGGPGPTSYSIFDRYVRAAATGEKIPAAITKKK